MTTDEMFDACDAAETLSVRDVCQIIQVAKTAGVKALRFGALQLTFKETVDTATGSAPATTTQKPKPVPSRIPAEEAAEAGTDDRIEGLEQDALALLLIEDPEAYERHLKSEDATDGDDGA